MCIETGVDSVEHGIMLEEDNIRQMREKSTFIVQTLEVYHKIAEHGEKGEFPESLCRKGRQVIKCHAESFRMALGAGVKIAAGSDSGSYWYDMGESSLRELELMNAEGMSPVECLKSATSRAAECLRMADMLGTVEPGKLADVLIVEGDPLRKISEIRNTWMVFKEGRLVFEKDRGLLS